ncbi:MAG: type II secretion system major pseudopilin GspG [Planctomycetes bacterium]|nr:type II secretion system major pseudopilin GspG [Planctomycetota bacterium]
MPEQNQCGCGCAEPGTTNAPRTSCAALWSLICGIAGMLLCLPAIPAIILGIIGLVNIKKGAGALKGKGKAIAGLILGGLAIIVMPILAIITAIAIPNIIHGRDVANESMAKAQIRNISTSLEQYRMDCGDYPSAEQGLQILISNDQGQKYLDKIPNDPWGRPYHYRYPGSYNPGSYDLWSDGKDGIEGTGDDVTGWQY